MKHPLIKYFDVNFLDLTGRMVTLLIQLYPFLVLLDNQLQEKMSTVALRKNANEMSVL